MERSTDLDLVNGIALLFTLVSLGVSALVVSPAHAAAACGAQRAFVAQGYSCCETRTSCAPSPLAVQQH